MKHDDLFIFENPRSPQHGRDAEAPWIHLMRMDSSVAASPVTEYGQQVNRDPKWAHLPDPLEAID